MPHQSNSRVQYLQLIMFACLVFGGRTSLGQINANNYDRVPSWRFQPPADPPSPTADTRTPAEISIEDNYFDSWTGAPDPLDGPPVQRPGTVVGSSPGGLDQDFPIWSRDEVVVAHFSTWLSHLSSSHRAVYTTVYLQVDRVVSDNSRWNHSGSRDAKGNFAPPPCRRLSLRAQYGVPHFPQPGAVASFLSIREGVEGG